MKICQKIVCFVLILTLSAALSACGEPATDYPDAASFEAALNNGENLEGKTVCFVVTAMVPGTALGYNMQAGEHLNFVSPIHPNVQAGDTVTVKTNTISSLFGAWLIQYEKISSKSGGGAAGNQEAPSAAPAAKSTAEAPEAETPKPLELADYGWYGSSSYSEDSIYVNFCGMIYNPNETLLATFPKVVATVKNGDGSILATADQGAFTVMPGDTITVCGSMSVPTAGMDEDTKIFFDLEWSDMKTSTYHSTARTTDFTITNLSVQKDGYHNSVTGEITNNYGEDVDQVNLCVVFRKEGKIVFMDNTFVDNLMIGRTKAFEISFYDDLPAYDTMEASAMPW